jgi:membrane-associated phospholipid phosphatase
MWSMLLLNLMAYATYLIYPAAPPWYVAHYGLGPAIVTAMPEPGAGVRFDHLLGVHAFANVYGRNANVFGAIPSLHVGQTFLAALFAWRFRSLRVLTTGFWLLVTFSSVYLNHHYLVDGILGILFALVSAGIIAGWPRRGTGPQPQSGPSA